MRFVILSRNSRLYSTKRLAETFRQRGHELAVVDPRLVQVQICEEELQVRFNNKRWPRLHAVLPRVGASSGPFALNVVRQFDLLGVPTVNDADSLALAHDKLRTLQTLSSHEVPVPSTVCIHSPDSVDYAVEAVGGYPVIVKLLSGSHGVGTMIAPSRESVLSLAQTLWAMGREIVLQRFVSEARGTDVRVLIVGGRVVAAMRRKASPGEFRSNLHRGGVAVSLKLDSVTKSVAKRAAEVVGLGVAGVDLVESRDGPLVLEVNSSPGLEGIERTTGVDVAACVVDHTEKMARESLRRQGDAQRSSPPRETYLEHGEIG